MIRTDSEDVDPSFGGSENLSYFQFYVVCRSNDRRTFPEKLAASRKVVCAVKIFHLVVHRYRQSGMTPSLSPSRDHDTVTPGGSLRLAMLPPSSS